MRFLPLFQASPLVKYSFLLLFSGKATILAIVGFHIKYLGCSGMSSFRWGVTIVYGKQVTPGK
jgi:hypothetical protein